jgi:hypothetical protein
MGEMGPLDTPTVRAPDSDDECGAVGGMIIGRGNRSTRENLPLCHFVHHKSYMTWDRTRAVAVGSRRLTA